MRIDDALRLNVPDRSLQMGLTKTFCANEPFRHVSQECHLPQFRKTSRSTSVIAYA